MNQQLLHGKWKKKHDMTTAAMLKNLATSHMWEEYVGKLEVAK